MRGGRREDEESGSGDTEALSRPSLGSLGARPGLNISRSGPPDLGQEAGTGPRRTFMVDFKAEASNMLLTFENGIILRHFITIAVLNLKYS